MCLGIPLQVNLIDGCNAHGEARGVRYASLLACMP
jgi:hydrogenase maturation factor